MGALKELLTTLGVGTLALALIGLLTFVVGGLVPLIQFVVGLVVIVTVFGVTVVAYFVGVFALNLFDAWLDRGSEIVWLPQEDDNSVASMPLPPAPRGPPPRPHSSKDPIV